MACVLADAVVGRRFEDGVDLSEGRWQKLAITRLHARGRDAGLGRADRCAGARAPHQASLPERALADRIVVLRQRRVRAAGTDEELGRAGGRYAELFEPRASA